MSKKSQILDLLAKGKEYDEIQETVEGATRQYIRNIASARKREDAKPGEVATETETEELAGEESKEVVIDGMEFENDLESTDNMVGGKMEDAKTGKEYHKAWVAEKAYECSCGCTLNRKSTFCPNCGTPLNWEGL